MRAMGHKDFEQPASRRIHDRIVDWLGAQGPSILTIYMCAAVALIAFVADLVR